MADPARTPLVSGSRLLFWPLAIAAVPAGIALPFAWSAWTVRGTLALVAIEAALLSLVLLWRDPLRFTRRVAPSCASWPSGCGQSRSE